MYVLASARQRFLGFDEKLFWKHGLRGKPYAAPRPSQTELTEIARGLHHVSRRGAAAFPYAGNHVMVTAANQPGFRQTVAIRQGLGNGESYPIRISALLKKYELVGRVDQSIQEQGDQLLFFDNADGQVTQITVAPEDTTRLAPKSLYQWAGGSHHKRILGPASVKNVDIWPETATVAIATHRGLEHERRDIFYTYQVEEAHPGRQQVWSNPLAIFAAVKIADDTVPTGLCLDKPPEIDGRFVDLSEI